MRIYLWAEGRKLKRSKIIGIAIFAVILTVAVVFAQGQFVFYGIRYIDKPGWLMNASISLSTYYVFPAVVALFGTYLINREYRDDTLKNLRIIPINEKRMQIAKLLLTALFSLGIYWVLFIITSVTESALHADELLAGELIAGFFSYTTVGLGTFLAAVPFIIILSTQQKYYWLSFIVVEILSFAGIFVSQIPILKIFYPITAVLSIAGVYTESVSHRLLSLLALMIFGSVALISLKKEKYLE